MIVKVEAIRRLPTEYEVVRDIHVDAGRGRRRLTDSALQAAEHFHVSFQTANAVFEIDLDHINLWAPGAKLIVNQNGVSSELAPPRVPTFRGRLTNGTTGGSVGATVLGDGTLRMHVYDAGNDLIVESASVFFDGVGSALPSLHLGDHIVYNDVKEMAGASAFDDALQHSSVERHQAPIVGFGVHDRRRRRLRSMILSNQSATATTAQQRRRLPDSLPTGPPYGRMNNGVDACPATPTYYTNIIGIVADHGFAAASVHPATATTANVLTAIGAIITSTNTIFVDQVGIEFSMGTTIINLDATASLAAGGPNYKPSTSPANARNLCGAEVSTGYYEYDIALPSGASSPVNVEIKEGHSKMLGRLSNWVGLSAPTCSGCSHWHLLTDCYPAAGTVGVAWTDVACEPLNSQRGVFTDTGTSCGDTCDVKVSSSGNAAQLSYYTSIECPVGEHVCLAPAALTSWTGSTTWRTFAHEIGHTFAAAHTFGMGGLMDYGSDDQFYDNGEVCADVNAILADTSGTNHQTNCLVTGNAVCGDGNRAIGGAEECDDGNTNANDGCSATCTIECGYVCSEDSNGLSSCTAKCGDNTVDHSFYEECDSSTACCTSATCKLADNAHCDGGQCCTSGCGYKHSRDACTTVTSGPSSSSDGYCGVAGECVASECRFYGLNSCEKPLTSTCIEHCQNGATCINLYAASSGAHGHLEAGTPCIIADSSSGLCDGSGTCVTTATCGNGVVEAGEECDDTSICCDDTTCKLASGAVCSSSIASECCTANCAFQTAVTACNSGSGFCSNGHCDTSMHLCTLTVNTDHTLTIDTTTCPIGAVSPGDAQGACAHSCKSTYDNSCWSGTQLTSDANMVYFLPEGTACNAATGNPATPVVQGVCVTDAGGTSRSCQAVANTCVLPYVSSGGSGGSGDPHLVFAHGGKADFRGTHRGWYAFVSSPGLQFNLMFQEVDFWLDTPTGLRQLVHGSFITEAVWVVRTAKGRMLYISTDAMAAANVDVYVRPPRGESIMSGLSPWSRGAMKPWQTLTFDDVRISTRTLTTVVETPVWQVNVTSKPIYGLVPPLLNETHVHGHWDEEQKRLDFLIHGAFPQPDAHGIVGQSYRDTVVRDGKFDVYLAETNPEKADSDGMLPPMTTSAQGEGAIDGDYLDYQMPGRFATEFAYSRFERAATAPLAGAVRSIRTATGSEWNGKGKYVHEP